MSERKISGISSLEVKQLLLEPHKVIVEIEGNINRVMIITNKKRRIIGYIQKFNEIIIKE